MRAGELRESIVIQKPVTTSDSYGSQSITYTDFISTRAKVDFNSGNRLLQNNEIFHTSIIAFKIRYYHDVSEDMIIKWDNKLYRILSIDKSLINQSITIQTELINE